MAADVSIQEANGAGPAYTDITSARYCTADSVTPGTVNPIPIPSAGSFNRSYWKSHCLVMSGTFTDISNIKWYSDGAEAWTLGTSGQIFIGTKGSGDNGCPTANYVQAGGTQGTTGNDIWDTTGDGYTYYSGETPSLATTYTSASPLSVDSTHYSAAGSRCKFVVTQVSVDDDATHGAQTAEVFTWRFDEV